MATKAQDDKKADEQRKASQKTFGEQADALGARAHAAGASGQTGPAQGQDPAVKLPVDESRDDVTMVEQNSHTGPAQEPVHRVAEPTADGDPAHEDEAKPKSRKKVKLGDAEVDQIVAMVKRAYEGLGVETMSDGGGRTWTAQYGHVNNQAAITVQLTHGDEVQSTVLATSGLNLDDDKHLHNAVKALGDQVK